MQNLDGEFVRATIAAVTVSPRRRLGGMPKDFRVSITNAPGKGVLSHLVVHLAAVLREPEGQGAGEDDGGLHEVGADRRGQKFAADSGTRRCQPEIVKLEMDALATIKVS